jgi:hypothetical protein
MKAKIVFAVTLLLMIVSVHGFAQSKPKMTDEQKKEMMDRYQAYKEKLNLTDEQASEVQKINTEYFEALSDLKNSDASRMEKFRKFRDANSTKDSKMEKVLSKEQYKMYKEFQSEIKKELKQNRRK